MLTRDQALAATAAVALAVLSEEEEIAAKHAFKTHTAKVATAAGAKWYHQPIGSLIFAKPHPHELAEHEKLVYVGAKAYSVPAQANVWVPPEVDLHNDAEVAASVKYVQLGPIGKTAKGVPYDGKLVVLTPAGEYTPGGMSEMKNPEDIQHWVSQLGWKQLAAEQQKVPVLIHGKLMGWSPPDWKLYSPASGDAVWAKEPDGTWHLWTSAGQSDLKAAVPAEKPEHWVATGELKPLGGPVKLPETQVPPAPQEEPFKPSPQPAWLSAKVSIPQGVNGKGGPGAGTIEVDAKQLDSAITILKNDQSTAVKQPLAKQGHPLADMAYHDISKQVLKEHPELKIPPGTKAKHVGQVKIAVLHHLNAKIAELAATAAQHAQAEEAAKEQAEHAEHAQEAAGHVVSLGGKEFTTEQVQHALELLEGSTHWKVLAILNNAGSPLGKGTWSAFKTWQLDHPEFGKDAKAGYIAWLNEVLDHAMVTDVHAAEEPSKMAQLHDEIAAEAKTVNLIPPSHSFSTIQEALAGALIVSYSTGAKQYVAQPSEGGNYLIGSSTPSLDDFYEVTQDHHVYHHAPGVLTPWTTGNTQILWHNGLASLKEKANDAALKAEPEPVKSLDQQISDLAAEIVTEPYSGLLQFKLAWAIHEVNKEGTLYVYRDKGTLGGWSVAVKYPPLGKPVEGTKVYRVEQWDKNEHYPGAAVTELTPSKTIDSEAAAGFNLLSKQSVLDLLHGEEPFNAIPQKLAEEAPAPPDWVVKWAKDIDFGAGKLYYQKGGFTEPWYYHTSSGIWYGISSGGSAQSLGPDWHVAGLVQVPLPAGLGDIGAEDKDNLAELVKKGNPGLQSAALKKGTPGAMVAFLLKYTTPAKPVRYFRVKDGKPLAATIAMPTAGKPGFPSLPFYQVTYEHKVRFYSSTGVKSDFTPSEIISMISDHMHPEQEKPEPAKPPLGGEWASIKPPTLAEAKELLESAEPGSAMYQVVHPAGKNGAGHPGEFYLMTPVGSWKFWDETDQYWHSASPEEFYHQWANEGGLKVVAQKHALAGTSPVTLIGTSPDAGEQIPALAASMAKQSGTGHKTLKWALAQAISQGGSTWIYPTGAKDENGEPYYVLGGSQKPGWDGGDYYHVVPPVPHEPGSSMAKMVFGDGPKSLIVYKSGIGLPKESVLAVLKGGTPGQTGEIAVNGKAFPLGSEVYYSVKAGAPGLTGPVKYVKKPDGTWWTVPSMIGPLGGLSEPYGYYDPDQLIKEGTLRPVPAELLPGSPGYQEFHQAGTEVPGFAQAAIEKGETLYGVDPATMPWAAKLPGAEMVATALGNVGNPGGEDGINVGLFTGPGAPEGKWAWQPVSAWPSVNIDLSKGWWEVTPDKQVNYHSPAAEVTDGEIQDLAAGKAQTAALAPLADKLGKAITLAISTGNTVYAAPSVSGVGNWAFFSQKPLTKPEYYSVSGVKVTHYTDKGATVHALSNEDVKKLLQGGEPAPGPGPGTTPVPPPEVIDALHNIIPGGQLYYKTDAEGLTIPWFAKKGDSWYSITKSGTAQLMAHPYNTDKQVAEGILVPVSDVPGPPEPAGPPVPVAVQGKLVGEVPAGSKLYLYAGQKETVYIQKPDGSWAYASKGAGVAGTTGAQTYENWLAKGILKEIEPPTPQEVANLKEAEGLRQMIHHGAVDPASMPDPGEPGAFSYALARGLAAKRHGNLPGGYGSTIWKPFFIWQGPDGEWEQSGKEFEAGEHYYEIDPVTLAVTPHGPLAPVSFDEVKAAIQQWITPNSVVVNGKLLKYGHYYKPKGSAHLEINGDPIGKNYGKLKYGPHRKAKYVWHSKDGSTKQMTATAAAAWLASGEPQWQAQAKGEVPAAAAKPLAYAKAFKPGTGPDLAGPEPYQVYTPDGLAGLKVYSDGSATDTDLTGLAHSRTADEVEQALKNGNILDQYGTTVVSPGIQPETYHLFGYGTKDYSKSMLEGLLHELELGGGASVGEHLGIVYGGAGYHALTGFLSDHGASEPSQQYDALKSLIHELLEVPENKAGASIAPAEVKYLKGLPPGIKGPQDIFAQDDLGYAKSPSWMAEGYKGMVGPGPNFYNWDNTDLTTKIKALSQEFGGGKIVGTHPAALTKAKKAGWLEAFKQGDMATVFALDAVGGKVSPAHPGAPANEATHNIIWGPWAAGETPAGVQVPGDWSDHEKVTLPKAEIDNYIIKANLQHAEYLSAAEKRSWVTWHRKHNQAQVDAISQQAHQRFNDGANTQTGVPKWTEGIVPAKSYDVDLEEKTPAANWGSGAVADFVGDHYDDPELKDAFQQWKDNSGSPYDYDHIMGSESYYSNKSSVVQQYLDALKAREEAEKLKPKYHAEPDPDTPASPPYSRVQDQFGWAGWWKSADAREQAHALAVAQLSKMWGYRTPEVRLAVLDDTVGVAREIPKQASQIAAEPDFASLTEREVSDIAREHVLDWALDNPGSIPGTFYSMPDGSIVGGDKSQALKSDLGSWDGLALNGQENLPGDQLSSAFYKAVMAHQVSHQLADAAYIAAIRAASRISKTPDQRFLQVLSPYTALKPVALNLEGLTARKNALPEDFQKLWAQVYKKAGWKLPEVPAERLRFGIHSGFSEPGFFDHVMASKSYGATAFFANPDMARSSFLVWTELAGKHADAPRLVRGETTLRRGALAAFTAWAKQHQTGDLTNMPAVPAGPPLPVNKGAYYKGVINAAKAVSKHAEDQNFEGEWTKKQLDWMATHVTALAGELKEAEGAIAKGPESKEYAQVKGKLGQPEYVASAAKHYLELFAQVQQAKDNAGSFKAGDLPDWDKSISAPLPEPKTEKGKKAKAAPPVVVEKKSVVRELGSIDPADGELKLGSGSTFDYPGSAWHITLPTGEVIEFQDSGDTGTKTAHTGRIRFKSDATKGSASLENVRAFLESAGVEMPEADDPYMEARYWRSFAGHLASRNDWNSGSYGKVWAEAAKQFGVPAANTQSGAEKLIDGVVKKKLDPGEEALLWRAAFAHITSKAQVDKFAEDGSYLPYFKHWDLRHPDAPNGHPVWMRFDYAPGTKEFPGGGPEFLAKQSLTHSFNGGTSDSPKVALSGGALSTEARLRVLGKWITGTSSHADMTTHGSSGVLYLRGAGYSHSNGNMKLSGKLLAQTGTRAYNYDGWGDVDQMKTKSPFNPKVSAGFSPTNETDVEDGASLLDDILLIEAGSEAAGIISKLHDLGITQIRGLPVEQRIVSSNTPAAAELVRKHDADNVAQWFARPDVPWEPPPSQVVTHAAIETEAELKGKSSDPGALGEEVSGVLASASEPEDVASPAQISQMFYGQDSKPSSVMSLAPKVKNDLAKRLSGEMTSSTDDLKALDQAAGLTYEQDWGSSDRERIIAGLVKTWAQTNSSPIIVALQHEAASLFGLSKEQLSALPGGFAPQTAAAKELEDKFGPELREFLRAQWALTQQDLAEHGIEDVTLYRIFKWNTPADWAQGAKAGDVIEAPPQYAVASWGYLQGAGAEIAGTYGSGSHSIVVKATFPRELLLSYPKTGFGSYNETEFTVLDAPGQWKIQKVT